ncbi:MULTISPECIES: CvpA family protein [Halanaerobiaceae]|uniref:CvpA family protein n=1 Tax=Halanaerobiaceae TaxID=972 RepID=UPI001E5E7536|nr:MULTISPECIES: CvpA family protein [Halanaerobiaceae]
MLLILFLYFVIGGFNKGFIKQTSMIIGIVFALLIAVNYYNGFQKYIAPYVETSPQLLQFISFAVLFIAVNVLVHLLGMVFKNVIDFLFLKPIDHAAGALLGLLKGGLLAYFLVLFLNKLPVTSISQQVQNSFLATRLLSMTPFLQQNLQNIFRP